MAMPSCPRRVPGHNRAYLERKLHLIAILSTVFTAHAQNAAKPAWALAIERSNAAIVAKDWKAAQAALQETLRQTHNHPRALYRLAAVQAALGDTKAALGTLAEYANAGLAAPKTLEGDFKAFATNTQYLKICLQLEANVKQISSGSIAFTLSDSGLTPEDIGFDAKTRRFFITSQHERKVITVDRQGIARDFVTREAGLWAVTGIAVDSGRRRVWVATAATEETPDIVAAEKDRTALLEFNADTANFLHRWELPLTQASRPFLGDIALSPDGSVIAGDSRGGVLCFRDGVPNPEVLAGDSEFSSAQEPAVTEDGRYALVPDYTRGLARLDLRTHEVRWLTLPSRGVVLAGIDGLVLRGTRAIAVQNGVSPQRILEITFNSALTAVLSTRILEQSTPQLNEPTHGILVDNNYYFIANSEAEKLAPGGNPKPGETLKPSLIMNLPIR